MAISTLKHNLLDPQNRINALMFALFLAMPFGFDPATASLLLLILIHTFISAKGTDWLAAFKNPIYVVSASFYLYYALSILWADGKADGASQLETKLSFLVSTLIVAANAKWLNKRSLERFKWALIWGCLGTMVVAFAVATGKSVEAGQTFFTSASGTPVSYFTYTELSSPFMHVGYLSTFVGVGILFLANDLIIKSPNRFGKIVLLLCLLFYMFMLQGRMNVLALLITGALLFVYHVVKYRAYKWFALPVLPIILLFVLMPFLPESISARYFQLPDFEYEITADASEFNSATYRLAEWKGAMTVIKENPIFGTGVGDNRKALIQAYEEIGFHVGVERHYNAHNQFLETTMAAGLVGLMLLLIFLGYWIFRSWKNDDQITAFTLVFFVLCMLTESMLERAWAVIFLAVYFSAVLVSSSSLVVNKKL